MTTVDLTINHTVRFTTNIRGLSFVVSGDELTITIPDLTKCVVEAGRAYIHLEELS